MKSVFSRLIYKSLPSDLRTNPQTEQLFDNRRAFIDKTH
jgi:hypothetical protein